MAKSIMISRCRSLLVWMIMRVYMEVHGMMQYYNTAKYFFPSRASVIPTLKSLMFGMASFHADAHCSWSAATCIAVPSVVQAACSKPLGMVLPMAKKHELCVNAAGRCGCDHMRHATSWQHTLGRGMPARSWSGSADMSQSWVRQTSGSTNSDCRPLTTHLKRTR